MSSKTKSGTFRHLYMANREIGQLRAALAEQVTRIQQITGMRDIALLSLRELQALTQHKDKEITKLMARHREAIERGDKISHDHETLRASYASDVVDSAAKVDRLTKHNETLVEQIARLSDRCDLLQAERDVVGQKLLATDQSVDRLETLAAELQALVSTRDMAIVQLRNALVNQALRFED